MLIELRKREYKLFLVSNASDGYFKACIDAKNYGDYFDAFYCVGETRVEKHRLVKKAMQDLNLSKGAMIGDKISDIEAGKINNLLKIGAAYGYGRASGPDDPASAVSVYQSHRVSGPAVSQRSDGYHAYPASL